MHAGNSRVVSNVLPSSTATREAQAAPSFVISDEGDPVENGSVGADTATRPPFEEEALAHLDALYRTALRMTRNPEDADDLVQDALVRAYRYYDQYQPGTNFRAWLFKILSNTFINAYRKKQVRPKESSLEDTEEFFLYHRVGEDGPEAVDDVAQTVLDRLGADSIRRAIDELPVQFRTVVQLADVEGLSYADIAEALGVAKGTVMSRLFRGRRQLQRTLWDQAQAEGYEEGKKVRPARSGANGSEETGRARRSPLGGVG